MVSNTNELELELAFCEKAATFSRLAAEMGIKVNFTRPEPFEKDELQKEIAFDVPGPKLEQFVDSPVHADVKLVIHGHTYYAHKKTLVASSKYFEAMFNPESGFKESSQFTVHVKLPVELSREETLGFLKLLYTRSYQQLRLVINSHYSPEFKAYCRLRYTVVAEYWQMESALPTFLDGMIKMGPSHFNKASKLDFGMMEQIIRLAVINRSDGKLSFNTIMNWFGIAYSLFPEQTARLIKLQKDLVDPIWNKLRFNEHLEIFLLIPFRLTIFFSSFLFRTVSSWYRYGCDVLEQWYHVVQRALGHETLKY